MDLTTINDLFGTPCKEGDVVAVSLYDKKQIRNSELVRIEEIVKHGKEKRIKYGDEFGGKVKNFIKVFNQSPNQKFTQEILSDLLEEALTLGFTNDYKNPITYLCAETGKECKQYSLPKEWINNEYHKDALTDGKGGWIRYNGKWAKILKNESK